MALRNVFSYNALALLHAMYAKNSKKENLKFLFIHIFNQVRVFPFSSSVLQSGVLEIPGKGSRQ